MNRRRFLKMAVIAPAASRFLEAEAHLTPRLEAQGWRTFEVTTDVDVLRSSGRTRIWVPVPLIADTAFQKTIGTTLRCHGAETRTYKSATESLGILTAEFPSGSKPALTLTSRVVTRDWAVDLATQSRTQAPDPPNLSAFLRPTKYVPIDGIVKSRAVQITSGIHKDLDKARAIYEWIVENTYRKPTTRGCGVGDIRFMLESGDLGGKCADLNALYVGLARAAGIPARNVYGIRAGKSNMGYKSLGTSSDAITKSQHCRAEVYLSGYGWVPVDPADVRKVILEEPPGNLPVNNTKVQAVRARLFGSWEMNWMAYNYAHEVVLPGSSGAPLKFFMYPQAETAEGRLDSLDPENLRYSITAREISPDSA